MEKGLRNYEFVQQTVQLAKIYHLCCRWAGKKHMNLVNLLVMIELYAEHDGCESAQLADMLYLPRQTVTYAVDALEEKGYLVRKQRETDRRRKSLHLTDAGAVFINSVMEEINQELDSFTKQLIPDRQLLTKQIDNYLALYEERLSEKG